MLVTHTEEDYVAGVARATLHYRDAHGAEAWSATWTAKIVRHSLDPSLIISDAKLTSDGGFILLGWSEQSPLDMGDRMLPTSGSQKTFVISLDSHGATQWAVAVDSVLTGYNSFVAAVSDGAVIGGEYLDSGSAALGLPVPDDYDSFLAHVDTSGAVTAHALGGSGMQFFEGLAIADDGSAIVRIRNLPTEASSAVMRIGNRILDDGRNGRAYVLNIMP